MSKNYEIWRGGRSHQSKHACKKSCKNSISRSKKKLVLAGENVYLFLPGWKGCVLLFRGEGSLGAMLTPPAPPTLPRTLWVQARGRGGPSMAPQVAGHRPPPGILRRRPATFSGDPQNVWASESRWNLTDFKGVAGSRDEFIGLQPAPGHSWPLAGIFPSLHPRGPMWVVACGVRR